MEDTTKGKENKQKKKGMYGVCVSVNRYINNSGTTCCMAFSGCLDTFFLFSCLYTVYTKITTLSISEVLRFGGRGKTQRGPFCRITADVETKLCHVSELWLEYCWLSVVGTRNNTVTSISAPQSYATMLQQSRGLDLRMFHPYLPASSEWFPSQPLLRKNGEESGMGWPEVNSTSLSWDLGIWFHIREVGLIGKRHILPYSITVAPTNSPEAP